MGTSVYSRWLRNQWKRVVYTDESKFNLDLVDGRIRVWRRSGERLDPANVIEYDNYGSGSDMIWGGISHQGKTELVTVKNRLNAARNCEEIILPIVVPYRITHDVTPLGTHNTFWRKTTSTHLMGCEITRCVANRTHVGLSWS